MLERSFFQVSASMLLIEDQARQGKQHREATREATLPVRCQGHVSHKSFFIIFVIVNGPISVTDLFR